MVAKIRLELDDATGPGFKSIEAGASKAENALDGASNAMNQTQAAAVLLASGLSQSEVAAMSMSDRIEMAEAAMLLPGAERSGGRSVLCHPDDYPGLYRHFLALFRLARSV